MRPDDNATAPATIGHNNGYEEADIMADDTNIDGMDTLASASAPAATSESETVTETETDHAVPAVDPEEHDMRDSMRDDADDADGADMSEMARLLDEQDVQFKSIKRGDVVEGQIVHIDADEILVDIG